MQRIFDRSLPRSWLPHALVVEDEPVARELIRSALDGLFSVDAVSGAAEALAAFDTAASWDALPELVCLDLVLGDGSGLDLLAEIRIREDRIGVPSAERARVLVVSQQSDASTIVRAFREQADGYVTKPFDRAVLRAKVAEFGLGSASKQALSSAAVGRSE